MRNRASTRNIGVTLVFSCLALIVLGWIVFSLLQQRAIRSAPTNIYEPEQKDVILFLEAVTRIKEHALFLSSAASREKIIQDTLKSYLTQHDNFSDYLTPKEYLRLKALQDDEYVGIGMEVEKDRQGRIVCFPYPGSPAEKAGVRAGDVLVSIDGRTVRGKSLFTVAAQVRGGSGAKIRLTLTTPAGMEKRVSVICSELTIESVSKQMLGGLTVIQVIKFTRNTKDKLEYIFRSMSKNEPRVIDLRGNPGGDFHAAIDSAALFLEEGKKIATVQSREGSRVYRSSNGTLVAGALLYLWQDAGTASAAEVFIAALIDNQKAVSIGTKTFGKASKQDIIELSDGSALVLTTGHLLTPEGLDYQGLGLDPTYQLKDNDSKTIDYLAKVKELMSSGGQENLN